MKLTISRPVQLALAITLVGTAVALLRPPPVELPILTAWTGSPAGGIRLPTPVQPAQSDPPWLRPQLPEPVAPPAPPAESGPSAPPPLAPAGPDDAPPLPAAPLASEPAAPDIVYLGRIIRDGKTQVFLASGGGEPLVLKAGDLLHGSWAIQAISSAHITLKHVHSGETQVIAMGGNASGAPSGSPHGGASGQVGQRFLGSSPADIHIQPVH
ncbi:hypothetical protein BKK81_01925 [Cupriavidus sp. USMAHM13]|uniref:Type II secretion system protein GspC N-terminal domain-containing protein n=1 Tax=Cupriavidus malaysiensis TaxID=367825 RepID=A0ABN4TER5_9BURK|nr:MULTISPECIES: hypothetical protein [Cupriavidus]AOY98192.1 hypothetical protein BKK81_01925 [Cupriavidus sp. USMAHM13]AOZ04629.1 hypothetical protein BKK80_01305 [Cupriavidus malaysiensis]